MHKNYKQLFKTKQRSISARNTFGNFTLTGCVYTFYFNIYFLFRYFSNSKSFRRRD